MRRTEILSAEAANNVPKQYGRKQRRRRRTYAGGRKVVTDNDSRPAKDLNA